MIDFKKKLKAKLIPLVFYACDEDNHTCSYYVWQSISKCLNNFDTIDDDFWSLLNVKKAFIPKLIALMRQHANGNANSHGLLQKLTKVFGINHEERLEFYNDFFNKISDCLFKESNIRNRFSFELNRNIMINALFDCLSFVISELLQVSDDENKQNIENFCKFSITNYVSLLFK